MKAKPQEVDLSWAAWRLLSLAVEAQMCSSCVCQPFHVPQTPNLAEANAAEEDKIKAMMIQSCCYYEPLK